MINLKLIEKKEETLIDNLMQLYIHELCSYFPIDFNEETCRYEYNLEPYFNKNKAYFILNDKKIIGFILVDINEDKSYEISEIFILNNYKRNGFAKISAYKIFNMYKGDWLIRAVPNSKNAESFWKSIINEYTKGNYKLEYTGKYKRAEFSFNNEVIK